MPDTDRPLPDFARRLLGASVDDRTAALDSVHPDYAAMEADWTLLIDAFEGTGGFADGSYLWPYRNELHEDYARRQQMARYHNYVETVIDLYVRHVFTQEPSRQTTNVDLQDWWEDVDGHRTTITGFLRKAVALALAAGHAGILMDATPDEAIGPAKADQRSRPFLTAFTATAIPDWRAVRNNVTGIKLREAVPDNGIADPAPDDTEQYLLWDVEGWARFSLKGELLDGGLSELGVLPFVVLRPKPSVLKPFVGRPLISNGRMVKALYNRMSEEDQVLRDQAFSLLTVECLPDADVEAAKKQLGAEFGTQRAVVVAGKVKYESPDMEVPAGIRANIAQIIREIYRAAHMRFESDSLQAESAEAIRLQYTELNEMLLGLATALKDTELTLARFFFLWTEPTPEAADAAFEAAEVSVEYPEEFFLADLRVELDSWAQAIAMDLGHTMTQRIKKRAVRRLDPEISVEEVKVIDAEIDAQPKDQQAQIDGMSTRLRTDARLRLDAKQRLHGTVPLPEKP